MADDRYVIIRPQANWFTAKPLNVPYALATGKYEDLTDEEIHDHACDIAAELARRELPPVPESGA